VNSKRKTQIPGILLIFALAFLSIEGRTQQDTSGNASDFTSVEYYPAPDQAQMKFKLSGSEAAPLPGGLLVIKQFKLELFSTNGEMQAIVRAPECTYDAVHGQANSAGQLYLQNGDGNIHLQGTGFLWRQADSFLTISNNVKTVIENNTVMREADHGGQKAP
jgi:hypothetical protein